MLKETELKILSSFFPEGKDITLKQIVQRTSLSYEPIYRNTQELLKKKLVSSKNFGKTKVYTLSFEKEEVKTAFLFYAKERLINFSKKHKAIFNSLSKLNQDSVDFLALFGSYSKGTETSKSDIDVICVSPEKKENEREIKGLKYETNLDFAPVVLPKTEFHKIKEENTIFWDDLVRFGIIFKGYELFYNEAYLK